MGEIFSALQHLKHNRHEVLFFHVTDKITELDFDFEDRPYEFHDLEKNLKLKLTPTDIKASYRSKMDLYYKELKLKCGQLKIDFIEADIKDDFDAIRNITKDLDMQPYGCIMIGHESRFRYSITGIQGSCRPESTPLT